MCVCSKIQGGRGQCKINLVLKNSNKLDIFETESPVSAVTARVGTTKKADAWSDGDLGGLDLSVYPNSTDFGLNFDSGSVKMVTGRGFQPGTSSVRQLPSRGPHIG
jgi:hypothetical protein